MFVRKKINSSGSISVQILEKTNRTNKLIQTVGSSKNEIEIERLYNRAFEIIDQLKQQSRFNFYSNQDESILNFTQQLSNSNIQAVGSQLIFGKLFDSMGFNAIDNKLFKDLVLSRIIYQGSKLKLTEYLKRYENKSISIQRIYRFLDKVHSSYKEQAEDIAFLHTKKVLKNITVVFYDMTTLYFESGDEDDFRKIGFSKDGKFQNPQIMLGLLVGEYGYPIGYELFEGNTFEGHTLIPVLEKFQKRFNLLKPIIIADSGLLSKRNIQQLKAKNYEYILGARIRTSDSKLSQEILSLNLNEYNSIGKIKTTDNDNLIVSYTPKRAKKDEYNRTKGLKRLEKKVKSGKLTKDQINSRGYNKYLHLKNEISVEIDYEKFYQDSYWDGLKGYITNTNLSNDAVISNYSNLWQIEKAFRMSKSDLEIRPIYHFTRRRIEAHISISFVAYSIYKELERLLYLYNAPFSVKKAREIIHNIYQIEVTLPDSGVKQKVLLQMDEEQQFLVNMIQNEISKSFGWPIDEVRSNENGTIIIPECNFKENNNFGGINIENTKNGTTVNRQKLDNFLNKIDRLKLLKIDVEGMEILVIKGAKELIDKFRPIIYVENDRQEHSKELIELLWSLDYKMYWHLPKLYNKSTFFCQEENIFGNIVSVNIFCIHKDLDIKVIDMVEVLDSSFHPMKR